MIDSRTFHVHSHAAKAFSVMHELRLQEQLCDVVLSVNGSKFQAHKVGGGGEWGGGEGSSSPPSSSSSSFCYSVLLFLLFLLIFGAVV